MIEKTSTLYKMIILYMLEKVSFPLSNNQITNFFLDREYTTYFHVQQTIHDLVESNLITEKKTEKVPAMKLRKKDERLCLTFTRTYPKRFVLKSTIISSKRPMR